MLSDDRIVIELLKEAAIFVLSIVENNKCSAKFAIKFAIKLAIKRS
jgi:hypothetical protein